jgi:glycosyltransferase involved in cell wall biosynthesis
VSAARGGLPLSLVRRLRARARGSRRVAVLFDHPWVETTPFVLEPIAALAAEGFEVELLAPDPWDWSGIEGVRYRPVPAYGRGVGSRTVAAVAALAARGALGRDYGLVLATPGASVLVGAALARLWAAPLVVLADELYTAADWQPHPRLRGAMRRAHERAALTIVPDVIRERAMVEDHPALAAQRFLELPNSPAGPMPSLDRAAARRAVRLPEDALIALCAGSLLPQMGLDVCLDAAARLPHGVVLAFRSNARLDDGTMSLCAGLESALPVRFLLDPTPYDRVDEVVCACDIGVALYRSSEPNFALCGKASGKAARFLRAGKPIIVDRGGALEWVARAGAGEAIDGADDFGAAVQQMASDLPGYAERARECHREHFAFERYWPPVRAALAGAMARG